MLNARCSIFDVRCSIFDVRCSIGLVFDKGLVRTVGFVRSGLVRSMFDTIDVQCDRCPMQLMFDAIDVRSSVRLVNEEAQDTAKVEEVVTS